MAVCDSRYRFIYFDVGSYGHRHNSRILDRSSLGRAIYEETIPFPEDDRIWEQGPELPYFFLGDGGFLLGRRIMKPFSGATRPEEAVFDFRLSRARTAKWRILLAPIETDVNFSSKIVASCIDLHNFVMNEDRGERSRCEDIPEARLTSARIQPRSSTSSSAAARSVRQNLVNYFQNEGAVEYQQVHSHFFIRPTTINARVSPFELSLSIAFSFYARGSTNSIALQHALRLQDLTEESTRPLCVSTRLCQLYKNDAGEAAVSDAKQRKFAFLSVDINVEFVFALLRVRRS
ncbi:hypothetical protein L596_010571 [Steinernema carpocapsae]|uniref:DDE Tnp4 domain-containing protein n=1 Tax=Steinernema carpocapsae TaxID=34508 RepID=A0A4U5PJ11_STECR|nr:hypothetical protein L596_010571 [Steinernema carpocapsae]